MTQLSPMPKTDALQQLSANGVSVWLDDLSRELLAGELDLLIEHYAVVGITTNPTIFAAALEQGDRYDEQLSSYARDGLRVDEAVFRITTDDVRAACDRLHSVYDATDHVNGRVSIEVDPGLAGNTDATIEEARRLWRAVDRPNLFVKVPATEAGIPAIEELISQGISVNVTLIFSLERYRDVATAYLAGLRAAAAKGLNLADIASVASFFVSRVDSAVNKLIAKDSRSEAEELRGKVAIANARSAYRIFEETQDSTRWEELRELGANPQRPLWASTGVKDPEFRDTLYVEELIAPQTVSTMPEHTLRAIADHGNISTDTITGHYEEAERVLQSAAKFGLDMSQITKDLEEDGVRKFVESWDGVKETVQAKLDSVQTHAEQHH